jgi:ParB family chromosome partitioning protein
MQLLYLDPQHIERDPTGVREEDGDLTGLIDTIREQGLLQPLGVVAQAHDQFRVVYGGRRLAAAKSLELERIPCLILDTNDPDLFLRQLIENLQRRDLNDIEKATGFRRLREQYVERDGEQAEGVLDERIGRAAGMAPRTVRRYLGLLDLPEEVQQLLRDEELSVTQAQHLRRIPTPRAQIELARLVADEGLSAAEVSRLATYFAANPNLTVDTAIQALQSGVELRTEAAAIVEQATARPIAPGATSTDDDLWEEEPESGEQGADGEPDFARLEAGYPLGESESSNKARVFQVRSLDQMVDETDRLARAYHDGNLVKWVRDDDAAPTKLRLLMKQLRSLSRALEEIAAQQGWDLATD